MKFKTGKLVDGESEESQVVEFDCWFDAIDSVLNEAGLFLYEIDEEGNEVK